MSYPFARRDGCAASAQVLDISFSVGDWSAGSFCTLLGHSKLLYDEQFVTYATGYSSDALGAAIGYATLMTVCITVGYAILATESIARRVPVPPALDVESEVTARVSIVLLIATLLAYGFLIRLSGLTVPEIFRNPLTFRALTSAGGIFYISGFVLWGIWTVFYVLFLRAFNHSDGRHKRRVVAGVASVVALTLTLPFGSRGFLLPV